MHFLRKTSADSHLYYLYFSFVEVVVTLSFLEVSEGTGLRVKCQKCIGLNELSPQMLFI